MKRFLPLLLVLPFALSGCAISEATQEGVIKPTKKGSILGLTLAGTALLTTNPVAFFAAGLVWAFVETGYDTQDALVEEKEERREERHDTNLANTALAAALASGDPEAIENAVTGLAVAQAKQEALRKAAEFEEDLGWRDKILLLALTLYILKQFLWRSVTRKQAEAVVLRESSPDGGPLPDKPP